MIVQLAFRVALLDALLLGGGGGVATPSGASPEGTIIGSKHDFSSYGWSQGKICLPCHTPHSAGSSDSGPLWNHSPSARGSYRLYDGGAGRAGAASLVCLSCHDGSTAVDAYDGMDGAQFIQDIGTGRATIGRGGDLRTDHPIGVQYPDFDRGFRPRVRIEAEGAVLLPGGQVECLSCHDVHNQYGVEKFLVKSNDRSALCLTCHRK